MSYPRNPVKRFVISIPIIGMIAFWGFRFLLGFSRLKKVGLGFIKWLIHSKEWTNYTYELTDVSQREMTGFFHVITGEDRKKLKEDSAAKGGSALKAWLLRNLVAEVSILLGFQVGALLNDLEKFFPD